MSNYREIYESIDREARLDRADTTRPLRREKEKLIRERERIEYRLKEIDKELSK